MPFGKKYRKAVEGLDLSQRFSVEEAVEKSLGASFAKFDETVDVAIGLGVDPKYSDQMVRGAVSLPHGLGKTVRVAVFCKGEKEAEARAAGADIAGAEELVAKIKEGWLEFDAAVATPDVMALVGRACRLQGRQGWRAPRPPRQGFLRSRKDPWQPQGSRRNREPPEAFRGQGHLYEEHGCLHHDGPRL